MEYIKLIGLNIDDFCSSIFFEDNYGINDIDEAKMQKEDLERKGYTCILANIRLNIQI